MTKSVAQELLDLEDLMNRGELEESLEALNNIEKYRSVPAEESLKILKMKSIIYNGLNQHETAINLAEQLYNKSQEIKIPLYSLDALAIKGNAYISLGKFNEFFKILEHHKNLFKSLEKNLKISDLKIITKED